MDRRSHIELPELGSGITLVDIEDDLGVTPVQTLLLDQLLVHDGAALWVDGNGAARTPRLRELAPHQRYLDRVHVGRAFTAYQHSSLTDRLSAMESTAPAVVAATGIDRWYRSDDIPTDRGESLLVQSLASLARVARLWDVPVLVTRVCDDEFSRPVANAATTHLHCRLTPFGPRYETDDSERETLVYQASDGWMQTTIAYWRRLLKHRARAHGRASSEQSPAPPAARAESE